MHHYLDSLHAPINSYSQRIFEHQIPVVQCPVWPHLKHSSPADAPPAARALVPVALEAGRVATPSGQAIGEFGVVRLGLSQTSKGIKFITVTKVANFSALETRR